MFEREIPDREGFKLGVAGSYAALMLMIELAEAGSHLPAAGAGRGDNHQFAAGFNIVIFSETVV